MLSSPAPLVSVIIPIYNTAVYLPQCLDSLLGQSFTEFELILVDDGSTDGSGAMADRYAAADARVRVIHQANQGVSAARNRGLDAATGTYVTFVDADDWVEAGYFEQLAAAASGYDILYFGGRRSNREGEKLETLDFEPADSRQTPMAELVGYLAESELLGRIWLMWIRRDLLEKGSIRFPEGIQLHEDFLFASACLAACRSLAFCPRHLYVYMDYSRQNRPTLSGRIPDNYEEIGLRCLALSSELFAAVHMPPARAEKLIRKKKEGFYIGCIEVTVRSARLSAGAKIRRIRQLRHTFGLKGRIRLYDNAPLKQRLFQLLLNTRSACLIWAGKWWILQRK